MHCTNTILNSLTLKKCSARRQHIEKLFQWQILSYISLPICASTCTLYRVHFTWLWKQFVLDLRDCQHNSLGVKCIPQYFNQKSVIVLMLYSILYTYLSCWIEKTAITLPNKCKLINNSLLLFSFNIFVKRKSYHEKVLIFIHKIDSFYDLWETCLLHTEIKTTI